MKRSQRNLLLAIFVFVWLVVLNFAGGNVNVALSLSEQMHDPVFKPQTVMLENENWPKNPTLVVGSKDFVQSVTTYLSLERVVWIPFEKLNLRSLVEITEALSLLPIKNPKLVLQHEPHIWSHMSSKYFVGPVFSLMKSVYSQEEISWRHRIAVLFLSVKYIIAQDSIAPVDSSYYGFETLSFRNDLDFHKSLKSNLIKINPREVTWVRYGEIWETISGSTLESEILKWENDYLRESIWGSFEELEKGR